MLLVLEVMIAPAYEPVTGSSGDNARDLGGGNTIHVALNSAAPLCE